MSDACAISSPMDPDIDFRNTSYQDKTVRKDLYMSLIGFLATRPNIAYAVTISVVGRYNETPLQMQLTAAKRVLRCLETAIEFELQSQHDFLSEVSLWTEPFTEVLFSRKPSAKPWIVYEKRSHLHQTLFLRHPPTGTIIAVYVLCLLIVRVWLWN